jgi:hypothetical protein
MIIKPKSGAGFPENDFCWLTLTTMPSEETKVRTTTMQFLVQSPKKKFRRSVLFAQLISAAYVYRTFHLSSMQGPLTSHIDRAPLWLDSVHHLCWLHAKQPSTVLD